MQPDNMHSLSVYMPTYQYYAFRPTEAKSLVYNQQYRIGFIVVIEILIYLFAKLSSL